jgi:hypothetical protein
VTHTKSVRNADGGKKLKKCQTFQRRRFRRRRPTTRRRFSKVLESILENTFFPLSLMTRPNKLECLYLSIHFQSSLTFTGNRKHLKGAPIGLALALPSNSKT